MKHLENATNSYAGNDVTQRCGARCGATTQGRLMMAGRSETPQQRWRNDVTQRRKYDVTHDGVR
jgi:hypothetical protein